MRNNCQDKYEDHNHLKDPELSNTWHSTSSNNSSGMKFLDIWRS